MNKAMKIIEDALIKAAEKFAEYERYHLVKNTSESLEKARVNHELVVMCQEALNQLTLIELGLKPIVKHCTRCEGAGNTLKGACVRCNGSGKSPTEFKTESDGV